MLNIMWKNFEEKGGYEFQIRGKNAQKWCKCYEWFYSVYTELTLVLESYIILLILHHKGNYSSICNSFVHVRNYSKICKS